MAKNRYFDTSFWDDQFIQDLNTAEKLSFIYFLTNPITNISGIYEISERRICFDIGITKEELKEIFKKFESKITYFEGFVIIKNFARYQNWRTMAKIKKGIDNALKSVPEKVLRKAKEFGYVYDIDFGTEEEPEIKPENTGKHLEVAVYFFEKFNKKFTVTTSPMNKDFMLSKIIYDKLNHDIDICKKTIDKYFANSFWFTKKSHSLQSFVNNIDEVISYNEKEQETKTDKSSDPYASQRLTIDQLIAAGNAQRKDDIWTGRADED